MHLHLIILLAVILLQYYFTYEKAQDFSHIEFVTYSPSTEVPFPSIVTELEATLFPCRSTGLLKCLFKEVCKKMKTR